MKNIITKAILITTVLFFYGCEQQDVCCVPLDQVDELGGNEWLLYETGHSPGSGYIITEVPAVPPQKIKFNEDGSLTHSIESWKDFKFYLILDDPQSDNDILSLYPRKTLSDDISKLEHSYIIVFDEGHLKLHYRWCIEGCHMGFNRIITK